MKRFVSPLLSFAAPLLIILGIFGFINRTGAERVQALPAMGVGAGLILSSAFGRSRRRKQLLIVLRRRGPEEF